MWVYHTWRCCGNNKFQIASFFPNIMQPWWSWSLFLYFFLLLHGENKADLSKKVTTLWKQNIKKWAVALNILNTASSVTNCTSDFLQSTFSLDKYLLVCGQHLFLDYFSHFRGSWFSVTFPSICPFGKLWTALHSVQSVNRSMTPNICLDHWG